MTVKVLGPTDVISSLGNVPLKSLKPNKPCDCKIPKRACHLHSKRHCTALNCRNIPKTSNSGHSQAVRPEQQPKSGQVVYQQQLSSFNGVVPGTDFTPTNIYLAHE
uniref:Uncharacterized protein n=1 Tax=Arundo donax TaxID=35708 RepID=A0A0A8XN05_ARUDO